MAIKLFVGSLAWATTDESLNHHFAQAGTVASARVVTDRETGRSRGFGFVEMSSDDEARNALATLNNTHPWNKLITECSIKNLTTQHRLKLSVCL
jgi:RNA recognition motif-containing protein